MNERRDVERVPLRMPVRHILGEDHECFCVTDDLSVDGMRITRVRGGAWGRPRFAWLQFSLPGENAGAIRALGELCHEDAVIDAATRGYRFKYINPRDRRRYEEFVRAVAVA